MIRTLLWFGTPLLSGLFLSRWLSSNWDDEVLIRCWMVLAAAPIVLRAVVSAPSQRNALAPPFSADRLFSKSLAILIGLLVLLSTAVVGASAGIEPTLVFLDDFLFILPVLLVGIPGYVLFSERITSIGEDEFSRFGAKLRGTQESSWSSHKTLLLSWALKAFFIPLMYGWTYIAFSQLLNLGRPTSLNWTVWLFNLGLSIDLIVGTAGYIFASKLFRSEIRSVDGTWFGWAACLICYPPLLEYLRLLTAQVDSHIWTDWVNPSQVTYWVWAAIIVGSWVVYWLATIAFGLRFSNLTYRGLVDIGPYRWSKHPAYLAKNVYWWAHTVPFFGVLSIGDFARNIFGLSVLSLVYYLRAKTEERHLMRFPEYAAYVRHLENNSVRNKLQRIFARTSTV